MSAHPQPQSLETLIDILVANPDRLETKKYAEMGIPMFLIGEDATPHASPNLSDNISTDILGEHFAALAATLALRKPELDSDDIAKLLEVLAERYFVADIHDQTDTTELVDPTQIVLPLAPPALAQLVTGMAQSRTIRVVNFHATPRYREAEFRRQIEEYAQLFEPITPANFASAVDGRWDHDRPGLIPAMFEGYRDNLDVMLPILEEFGFTGWFFVPSGFLNVPAHEQRTYAASHDLFLAELDEYPEERIALTWDEARDIVRRGHAFACHTRTHNKVEQDTPADVLHDEILVAKREMEAELQTPIDMFCWLEGAAVGVNPVADDLLRQAGFRYLVSNFKIQKLQ